MFEITFAQYENEEFVGNKVYQIPASSELNAAFILGQIYCREETTVKILSIDLI